jgi:acyl carrier protein
MITDPRVDLERRLERALRSVVADHLGVELHELSPEVSLADDLAADSLDMLELALRLQASLGFTLPERVVSEVRTYGDLIATIGALLQPPDTPVFFWARVDAPGGVARTLHRSGWLTPYAAEALVEDALRGGPGARMELMLPTSTSDSNLAWANARFAWLSRHGIQAQVRRGGTEPGLVPRPRAA